MIWERQAGESSKAYLAFCVYRDAGTERSLQKVSHEIAKSVPLVKRWSRNHDWVSRVLALEEHEERIRHEAREAVRREVAIDLARREVDLREQIFENEERAVRLESEMIGRFERMLEELPLVECEEIVDRNGVPVRCVFKPAVPDIALTIKRLHEISTRSLPVKTSSEEVPDFYLTDEDREELEALRGDPELSGLLAKLFSRKLNESSGEDDAGPGTG